jgi:hypothetical protein
MPLQARCVGLEIDLWTPQCGVVHSTFERAVNLLMAGELWTVLGPQQRDAPFGIRLALDSRIAAFAVKAADRVQLRAGYVRMGQQIVDCRAAARWAPTRWSAPASGLAARVSIVEQKARPRAWPGSIEIASDLVSALRGSDSDLARAMRRSVGRGPGLTPSGDDVLLGMLTVLTSGAARTAAVPVASRLIGALAPLQHSTPDISRHLLNQAARGLPGRALHELGKALWEGAPDDVLSDALQIVLDTGYTSGADACLGLAAACRLSLVPAEGPTS